jgi:hypothetical protein
MGEKNSIQGDYYMEMDTESDFQKAVDPFRHGSSAGSNYLMVDMHVETQVISQLDSWSFNTSATPASTQPD